MVSAVNYEDSMVAAGRAVASAGWLCACCRNRAERWVGCAGGPEVRRWADEERGAKAAKAYADFYSDHFAEGIGAMMKDDDDLSAYGLAARLGMHLQTIGPITKGENKPTPHTTARMAFILRGGLTGWALHFDTLFLQTVAKSAP
jgi:hypothetical protein